MSEDLEREPGLGQEFALLRAEDRLHAPQLSALLTRERRARSPRRTGWAPLVAVTLMVVLSTLALVWWSRGERPSSSEAEATALVAWRSPTDWLLQTPGVELFGRPPRLGGLPELGEWLPSSGPTVEPAETLIPRKEDEP